MSIWVCKWASSPRLIHVYCCTPALLLTNRLLIVPIIASIQTHSQVVSHWVGLRPGRSRVRLELDAHGLAVGQGVQERAQTQEQGPAGGAPGSSSTSDGGGPHVVPLVHNYGHGGAGLTLAWGCAGDVVSLLVNAGVVV